MSSSPAVDLTCRQQLFFPWTSASPTSSIIMPPVSPTSSDSLPFAAPAAVSSSSCIFSAGVPCSSVNSYSDVSCFSAASPCMGSGGPHAFALSPAAAVQVHEPRHARLALKKKREARCRSRGSMVCLNAEESCEKEESGEKEEEFSEEETWTGEIGGVYCSRFNKRKKRFCSAASFSSETYDSCYDFSEYMSNPSTASYDQHHQHLQQRRQQQSLGRQQDGEQQQHLDKHQRCKQQQHLGQQQHLEQQQQLLEQQHQHSVLQQQQLEHQQQQSNFFSTLELSTGNKYTRKKGREEEAAEIASHAEGAAGDAREDSTGTIDATSWNGATCNIFAKSGHVSVLEGPAATHTEEIRRQQQCYHREEGEEIGGGVRDFHRSFHFCWRDKPLSSPLRHPLSDCSERTRHSDEGSTPLLCTASNSLACSSSHTSSSSSPSPAALSLHKKTHQSSIRSFPSSSSVAAGAYDTSHSSLPSSSSSSRSSVAPGIYNVRHATLMDAATPDYQQQQQEHCYSWRSSPVIAKRRTDAVVPLREEARKEEREPAASFYNTTSDYVSSPAFADSHSSASAAVASVSLTAYSWGDEGKHQHIASKDQEQVLTPVQQQLKRQLQLQLEQQMKLYKQQLLRTEPQPRGYCDSEY